MMNEADGGTSNPNVTNSSFYINSAAVSGGGMVNKSANGGSSSPFVGSVEVAGETPTCAAICFPVQRWRRSRSISPMTV